MKEKELPSLIPIVRLSKDVIAAIRAGAEARAAGQPLVTGPAGVANATEARVMVDLYYAMQDQRKALANQIGAIDRRVDAGVQHTYADLLLVQVQTTEDNAAMFLEAFASAHPLWPWFSAVTGIGPVLAAGLIAHLGGRPVPPTVGHWWRFAGLDPTQRWHKSDELARMWADRSEDVETRTRILARIIGRDPETVIRDATLDFKTGEVSALTKAKALKSLARIPFNRPLKTLCWKVGDQFVKLGSREDAVYARYYRQRKADEIARNERGDRAALAARTLDEKPGHAQRAIYAEGRLPDGRVDLMARRATVKLFLSHLHEVWYRVENDGAAPPAPFSVSIQGHGHYIPPPYLDVMGFGESKAA